MTLLKSTLFAAAAAIALTGFATTFAPKSAEASINSPRLNECARYKSRAMSLGRAGNRAGADQYWSLYSDCLKYRID